MTAPRLFARRARAAAAAAAAAVLLAACAAGRPAVEREGDAAGERRVARLLARTTPAVDGTATLGPADEPGQMVVRVTLRTSPSNAGVHAWRLVRGSCGVSSGTIVGSAAHYPVVRIEATGTGESVATVPLRPDEPGTLSVRILASPTNPRLIACGDLR